MYCSESQIDLGHIWNELLHVINATVLVLWRIKSFFCKFHSNKNSDDIESMRWLTDGQWADHPARRFPEDTTAAEHRVWVNLTLRAHFCSCCRVSAEDGPETRVRARCGSLAWFWKAQYLWTYLTLFKLVRSNKVDFNSFITIHPW